MVGACKYILSIVVMHMVSGINISLLQSTDHMQRNKFLHVARPRAEAIATGPRLTDREN